VNSQPAPFENNATKQNLAAQARCEAAGTSSEKVDVNSVFAKLLRPAQERVFRLALRITRSSEDAEDVQQETFLKVHGRWDNSKDGPASPPGYRESRSTKR
jgi:DNA-directed RNA polymerase specialized sigma24 family protein